MPVQSGGVGGTRGVRGGRGSGATSAAVVCDRRRPSGRRPSPTDRPVSCRLRVGAWSGGWSAARPCAARGQCARLAGGGSNARSRRAGVPRRGGRPPGGGRRAARRRPWLDRRCASRRRTWRGRCGGWCARLGGVHPADEAGGGAAAPRGWRRRCKRPRRLAHQPAASAHATQEK